MQFLFLHFPTRECFISEDHELVEINQGENGYLKLE